MSYELSFPPDALSEWKKPDGSICELFKKKPSERLHNPRVPSARLSGHKDRYKIKLRDAGYHRLVYEVRDKVLVIVVVAVGKRERNLV